MMDLHSNLIIDGYEIMNDEGTSIGGQRRLPISISDI